MLDADVSLTRSAGRCGRDEAADFVFFSAAVDLSTLIFTTSLFFAIENGGDVPERHQLLLGYSTYLHTSA